MHMTKEEICGDYSGEDTPVPIPNTEVKLLSADDTWRATSRESRTLPLISLYGPMVKRLRHRPFTAVTRVRFPVGSPDEMAAAQSAAAIFLWCARRAHVLTGESPESAR